MPTSIKIYPPTRLPDRNVSETQFNIWSEELEVYLSQETDFATFLPGGRYENWVSAEVNEHRIVAIKEEDTITAGETIERRVITEERANAINLETLTKIRKNLRTVLSIIGKCVSEGHYTNVIRHSSSIRWIYDTLRSDYDIQQKGIHFFNLLDAKYDSDSTPVSFYNKYRTIVINNLAKSGDTIKYKNNLTLNEDEKTTPMLEDLILLNVVR